MKPWQVEIEAKQQAPAAQTRVGEYAEEVETEAGPHVRTRPGEGFTPPGGGRPEGQTLDNAPINYGVKHLEVEYGIRDNEELYAPPPPEMPKKPGLPVMPQEFEQTWQDRYMRRTEAAAAKPGAIVNTEAFLRPEKGVTVGASGSLEFPDDQKIAQLEQQLQQRKDELIREQWEKAKKAEKSQYTLSSYEIRIIVTDGLSACLLVDKRGKLNTITKKLVIELLGQIQ